MRPAVSTCVLLLVLGGSASAQQTADYEYDRVGRLTRMADGAVVVSYAYDAGGNLLERSVVPDSDGDRVGDDIDLCPAWADPDQADTDGNGIGDACECGDQTGDGTVNVADVLAINEVIFELQAAGPLCDTNDDAQCNVADILGANAKIFGAPAYCARYPSPP